MKRKRHIHYGRVLAFASLIGSLTFGIVRIIDESVPTHLSLPEASAVETEYIPATADSLVDSVPLIVTESQPPASIQLKIPYISQEGILPTGCELISAMMLLSHYGADVTVEEVVNNTFCAYPVTEGDRTHGYSPYRAFIGSPYDASSFGCYPPVIVDMMNALLPEGKQAVDITGMALPEIAETYLLQGEPVLVWATINMMETELRVGWYLLDEEGNKTDEWYNWKANEHCLVLVGYDEECYYFNDPYEGNGLVGYSRELAETRYAEIGMCAVAVHTE